MLDLDISLRSIAVLIAVIPIVFACYWLWRNSFAISAARNLKPKMILTPTEQKTMDYLIEALPEARIFPQVSMAAIVTTKLSLSPRKKLYWRGKFGQKIIDYVIQDKQSGKILALVELDDWSHNPHKDKLRDQMTAAAGYKTIRLPAGSYPTYHNVSKAVRKGIYGR